MSIEECKPVKTLKIHKRPRNWTIQNNVNVFLTHFYFGVSGDIFQKVSLLIKKVAYLLPPKNPTTAEICCNSPWKIAEYGFQSSRIDC